jgi:hypothetical protein
VSRALLGSLYPGAPFERKFLAMLLLNTLLAVWNTPDKAVRCSSPGIGQREGCLAGLLRAADAQGIHLLCPSFLGAKTVQASTSHLLRMTASEMCGPPPSFACMPPSSITPSPTAVRIKQATKRAAELAWGRLACRV